MSERKDITMRVSVKQIEEKPFEGKPYTNAAGETKKPMLRGINLPFLQDNEVKWGRIVVRDNDINKMRDLSDKNRPIIRGMYIFHLSPDVEYTVTFRKKTGEQIPNPKNPNEMVNEWVNDPQKMTGQQIKESVDEAKKNYKEEKSVEKEEVSEEKEKAEPEEEIEPKSKKNSKSR